MEMSSGPATAYWCAFFFLGSEKVDDRQVDQGFVIVWFSCRRDWPWRHTLSLKYGVWRLWKNKRGGVLPVRPVMRSSHTRSGVRARTTHNYHLHELNRYVPCCTGYTTHTLGHESGISVILHDLLRTGEGDELLNSNFWPLGHPSPSRTPSRLTVGRGYWFGWAG